MIYNQIKLGIMQGRLLPKFKSRYQAHPLGYWQSEFKLASQRGIDCIEFILDYNDYEQNPLLRSNGINQIKHEIKKNSVTVESICADYFMEAPFHSKNIDKVKKSIDVLNHLIYNSSSLGIKNIIIPCVDNSSIKKKDFDLICKQLEEPLKIAERKLINLCLETDLSPLDFQNLLNQFSSNHVKVNYDIGNSTSLGYNMNEEFAAYGESIVDVHIKDRSFGGGSVELGKGAANFDLLLKNLLEINYKGIIVMQAFRDDDGIKIFDKQFAHFKKKFKKIL